MKRFLITGSTSGLGYKIVNHISRKENVQIIMAVRNIDKGKEIAKTLGSNVSAVYLDLSKLSNIVDFAENWDIKFDGLINNAGVQFTSSTNFTSDGFEETIAVNYVAAFLLTLLMEKYLINGKVLFIGSGTHNPKHPIAPIFGFRGCQYTSIKELLQGKGKSSDTKQLNLDRYATSKFLITVSAVEIARRYNNFLTYVLDPGLMPGTKLARNQNLIMRFLWRTIMPIIGIFLPDTTSSRRSAHTVSWIINENNIKHKSGTIFSYNCKPNKYVWEEMVLNPDIGKEVYDDTISIINNYCNLSLK